MEAESLGTVLVSQPLPLSLPHPLPSIHSSKGSEVITKPRTRAPITTSGHRSSEGLLKSLDTSPRSQLAQWGEFLTPLRNHSPSIWCECHMVPVNEAIASSHLANKMASYFIICYEYPCPLPHHRLMVLCRTCDFPTNQGLSPIPL